MYWNTWPMDRWHVDTGALSTSNTLSVTIRQDYPRGIPNGFSNVANIFVTNTFLTNYGNTWLCPLVQTIEASSTYDIRMGYSTAQSMTLSFSANVYPVGNYSVVVRSHIDNTYYATSVALTNSWNRYSITMPPCTIGSWPTGTDGGIEVCLFGLAFGTVRANVASTTVWTANPGYPVVGVQGVVNWAATPNSYLQVTGAQLEVGPVATPSEIRPLVDVTRYCLRYFEANPQIQYSAALPSGRVASIPYVVTKRNNANVTVYVDSANLNANTNISQFTYFTGNGTTGTLSVNSYIPSTYGFSLNFTQTGNNFNTLACEADFVWKADAEIY